ncbi:cell wall metabolism sensor histidine kinase WalK [Streptomyces sp. NP160]|uniref:sensor histidine kinase n=1 Tax=Streptomyces sp. NP160 TaxID=2586637 RepID=UPI0015D60E6B|nr:HAMP domain-containing sensor histidine kinase [Streptomyces sp. NP160]
MTDRAVEQGTGRTTTDDASRTPPRGVRAAYGSAREQVLHRGHELSLRARLIAVVTGLLVVALLLTGTVTLLVLQRVLLAQTDEQLRTAVVAASGYGAGLAVGGNSGLPPTDYVVQVSGPDGSVVVPSQRTQSGEQLKLTGITQAWVQDHRNEPQTIQDDITGDEWRVIAVPDQKQSGASIAVARSLTPVDHTLKDVAAYFVLVGVVVVVACVVLGAYGVRRAFRPLRDVEAVAAAFGGGDTSRRVPVLAPGTEVGRLGTAINAMLDDIETSLAAREASEGRMRRFVADASHELRTPLSAIRGFAEMHRMGVVRKEADVTTAFSRIESEATRMGGLVEDLLVLARLDEQRPMRRDPVDLFAVVADARHDARALAPDRVVSVTGVDGAPPRPVVVTGDEAKLRQVLANLIGNALRHTPAGTPVELGVGQRDGWAVWAVVDHGPGIPPEDASRVFERFWRADSSRQRGAGGGAGLGMAIVAGIVQAHGGAVRVVQTPGGGATIEVALPLADAPTAEEPQDDDSAVDEAPTPVDEPVDNGASSTGGGSSQRRDPGPP